jgi:hypothetical protein
LKLRLNPEIGGLPLQLLKTFLPKIGLGLGFRRGRTPLRIGDSRSPPITVGIELLP